jgi:hypothetical protein
MGTFVDIQGNFNGEWLHGVERSVDSGWHTLGRRVEGEVGDQGIKIPPGLFVRYADESVPNPFDDGADSSKFAKPEIDIKLESQLPEDERSTGPDPLIIFPPQVLKPFKGGRAFRCEFLYQMELHGEYVFWPRYRPDPIAGYKDGKKVYADDRSAFVYFMFNGEGRDDIIDVSPKSDMALWDIQEFAFRADGVVEFGLGLLSPWGLWHGSNWFLDGWRLEKVGEIPTDHRGKPRFQYERTYVLLHTSASKSWSIAVAEATWNDRHYTIGSSADDSGVGDLDVRQIVAVNPKLWGPGEDGRGLLGFYEKYYPGVDARQVVVDTPTALVEALKTPFDDLPALEQYSEDPPPPPPNTGKFNFTLHCQTGYEGIENFLSVVKPWGVKTVGGVEDLVRYKAAGAKNGIARYMTHWDENTTVDGYLAQFQDSLETNMAAGGIDVIEILNEQDPNNPKVIRFLINASNELYRRYGTDVRAALGNWAVGNGDGPQLLDLARVIEANHHTMGQHTYFPVCLQYAEAWMESEAQWYHMRHNLHIDPHFVSNGVFVDWLGTESGAVEGVPVESVGYRLKSLAALVVGGERPIPRARINPSFLKLKQIPLIYQPKNVEEARKQLKLMGDMVRAGVGPLDPTGGWRDDDALNGDLPRYTNLILRCRDKKRAWNADHQNRDLGDCIFTVGQKFIDWLNFRLETGDMDYLASALAK